MTNANLKFSRSFSKAVWATTTASIVLGGFALTGLGAYVVIHFVTKFW
jgi:hypothetical protein